LCVWILLEEGLTTALREERCWQKLFLHMLYAIQLTSWPSAWEFWPGICVVKFSKSKKETHHLPNDFLTCRLSLHLARVTGQVFFFHGNDEKKMRLTALFLWLWLLWQSVRYTFIYQNILVPPIWPSCNFILFPETTLHSSGTLGPAPSFEFHSGCQG
jgi:hypothetical protein